MSQPAPVTPVCYRHPSRETWVRCVRCDRPICPDCMRVASVGHQCPECVAEGNRTVRTARTAFGGSQAGTLGYVTIALVGLNVLMLIVSVLSDRGGGLAGSGFLSLFGGTTPLDLWGGLIPDAAPLYDPETGQQVAVEEGVASGDYYRLLTSMFLHAGIFHLLMNMWALWVLGRQLEYAFGPIRFLALYLLSGLGGSVAVYLFGAPAGLTVGASGAIFGLFSAFFLVLRRLGRDTSALVPILVINLVITFAVPSISIAGHIGGLVSGALLGAGLAYAPQRNRTAVQVAVCARFAALLVLLVVIRTATFR